jgi:hypothetical protein
MGFRVLALVFSFVFIASASACATDDDCERLGLCVNSTCVCDAGWTGPSCSQLNLAPAPHSPAYAWPLDVSTNSSSWGLAAVYDPADGLFHGLAEVSCGLMGIMVGPGTFIVHMTSPNGASDWVLSKKHPVWGGTTAFNPQVVRAINGTFIVVFRNGGVDSGYDYCPGNSSLPAPPGFADDPSISPALLVNGIANMVAYAPTMEGPWSVANMSILGDGTVWKSNPSIWELRNPVGSARWILSFRYNQSPPPAKGVSVEVGNGEERNAIALADSFLGPWQFLTNITQGSPLGVNEDPFVWQQPGQDKMAHVLYHNWVDPNGPGPFTGGHHAWGPLNLSEGLWLTSTNLAFPVNASLDNGTVLSFARRERPWLNFHKNGTPSHLITGVVVGEGNSEQCVSFAQPIAI